MGGITNVNTAVPRPTLKPSVNAGGGTTTTPVTAASMTGDTMTSTIRMSEPIAKFAWDKISPLIHHAPANVVVGPAPAPINPAPIPNPAPVAKVGFQQVGGAISEAGSGISNFFHDFGAAFKASLKSNFIISAVVAGASDLMDLVTGNSTPTQAAVTFGADTLAYTGIGATASGIGAALGSLIPIPFVGTAIGLVAGMGLGYLYENMVRPEIKAMA